MKKVMITCAITGAETSRNDHPGLPVSPQEIAESAHDAYLAGASIIHLHVRDENHQPTQSIHIFKDTITRIRQKCDVLIEITTGGALGMSLEERLAPLQLSPEMASLDCGSVNFGEDCFVNTWPMIKKAAQEIQAMGVKPTLECFDLSHIDSVRRLIQEGAISPPFHYGFVFNVPGGLLLSQDALECLYSRMPKPGFWTMIVVGGKDHLKGINLALLRGGHIRVGFEDNIVYRKGQIAETNACLVERAHFYIQAVGFQVAKPNDVCKMLNIKRG